MSIENENGNFAKPLLCAGRFISTKFNLKKMAWSKINGKEKKPWRWWMHKFFCEWGWLVRNRDNYATYNHHLKMCCKQGFNLYGERI